MTGERTLLTQESLQSNQPATLQWSVHYPEPRGPNERCASGQSFSMGNCFAILFFAWAALSLNAAIKSLF